MASRRMITSDIFSDDWYGQLGFFEQQLWIGLFAKCADDQGRLLDNAFLIRAALFPYKDVAGSEIDAVLATFAEAGKIVRYQADDKALMQICNWWQHQRPQWASVSLWPAPDSWQDRVRTRANNAYIEEGWDSAGGFTLVVQVNGQPEEPSTDVQPGRQLPVPIPVSVPVPVPEDISAPEAPAAAPPPTDPPADAPAPKRANPRSDTRSKTAAIQCAYAVNDRKYPPLALFDRLIEILGDRPDGPKLRKCREEWVERGYNPASWKWATEWYVTGIPAKNGAGARASPRGVQPIDTDPESWLAEAERVRAMRGD